MGNVHFLRPGHAGPADLLVRTPELLALREHTMSLFGVGCLGAPCALELARAGIRRLRLLDHDYIDPATVVRWPFGFEAAGVPKVLVLERFIGSNYPWTEVDPHVYRLGAVHLQVTKETPSDHQVVEAMTKDTSLIMDATAEIGVQQYLSDYAKHRGLPYIGLSATNGGWGGKIFRFIPGVTRGCWFCYRQSLLDGRIAVPPSRPDDTAQPTGCDDPTFTGCNFDMIAVAMTAVRFAVATLCRGSAGGYPPLPWDVMTVALRDGAGNAIAPHYKGFTLERHPNCPVCNPA